VGCALLALPAFADPIPAATFTFDVTQGTTPIPGCTPVGGSPFGGTCGSEASAPGFAATSGGIGTPSFLPVTAGGTALGSGTAVDAMSIWGSGSAVRSSAMLTYSFEARGPASVNFIPIDVISTGLTALAGNATVNLSLIVKDAAGDANIPKGVRDPDPNSPLLSLSAHCANGNCVTDWSTPGHQLTDLLCVVNGDNYTMTITAMTTAGRSTAGMASSASAVVDPVIVLDPPSPQSCPLGVSASAVHINTSPGTSTGVPEPPSLGLMALGAVGLWLRARRRRLTVWSA
jgi:PEP-CTERM motif